MATKGTGKGLRDIERPEREEGGGRKREEREGRNKRESGYPESWGGEGGRKRGGKIKSSEGHSTPPLKGSPHPGSPWTSNPTPWVHSLLGDRGPPPPPPSWVLQAPPCSALCP